MRIKRGRLSILFLVIVSLLGTRAEAWWDTGHSFITTNSVQHLPNPLKLYVSANFNQINPYATNEPPGAHFIDIDAYPEFQPNGTFPRDLNALYTAHGTAFVDSHGISPWVIANYRQTIKTQMMTAATAAQWTAMWRNMGEMAHYIEDIHQPLHTTQNYNGQFTGNGGIHARYEGSMIEQHFDDLLITADPQDCVYIPDSVDRVLTSIDTTWGYVDDIMAADTLAKTVGSTTSPAYYNSMWSSTGNFTHTQFQLATEMVASTWYSAWIDAGSPVLGVPEPGSVLALGAFSLLILRPRRARIDA